jgi:DNA-binding IclR family transcriptional regulator
MTQLEVETQRTFKGVEPHAYGTELDSNELNTSVGKALALLTAFDRATPIGVSELARKTNVPKSTAFRLLAVLTHWQLIERVGSRYRLGTLLFEIGNKVSYCCPSGLRETAHPYLEELHEATRQTVHLAILVDHDVLYLDKVYGHDQVRSPSRIGGRVPAHCSALGKAMLAFTSSSLVDELLTSHLERLTPYTMVQARLFREELAEIRSAGVAYDREGARLGLACVAAPIRSRRKEVVAALSISGSSTNFEPDRHVSRIRRVAAQIGDRIYL